MKTTFFSLLILLLFSCSNQKDSKNNPNSKVGTLEIVAELPINPGNVTVSKEGRIFATIHPLRPENVQLIEITGTTSFEPFPNEQYQSKVNHKTDFSFDTPLGLVIDRKNRLWVVDAGLNLGKTRIFLFDVTSGKELMRFEVPKDLTPKNSFVQDIAVDENNDWVYLADFGNPGIIALDINKGTFRKFSDLKTMSSEDINIVIDDKVALFNGSPARIGINPITLSADNETLFFGAMNGTKWYKIPTKLFRDKKSDDEIIEQIEVEGNKPISDGASTDAEGNHFFTNIENGSIDILTKKGVLKTLVKDDKIDWADNVHFGNQSWLYIAVNQLQKSPVFNGGKDEGKPPYYILRTWTGTNGISGR